MERRVYQRVSVGAEGNFIIYSKMSGDCEFNGILEDISESGICIKVVNQQFFDIASGIQMGDVIMFQAMDQYMLYDEMRIDVFSGEATVVRMVDKDYEKVFGCIISKSTPELSAYIRNKKLSSFMNSGFYQPIRRKQIDE